MAPRASSPALSENEFDIGSALFGDDNTRQESGNGADLGLDLDIGNEDGSDDEAFIAATQAASNRKSSNLKGKTVKKGGGFQAMGLNAALLKAITGKGFKVPTPIQRKAVPLILDRQDVVGMARTGSGKTAAFVIPMIQALKTHSAKVGARAIILSPSRELALQTLKVVKELGRGTDLRTVLVVGGDSLDEQFNSMTSNPDIIIATPGRFLHLKVEMDLDLSSVRYIVFDEADRLFEMGFAAQLGEILHALPSSRQTLLFSATLPKTLVEFARAGLQDPKLIRLDDSKVSPDLENAFFTVKSAERDAALLYLLDQVIKIPMGETEAAKRAKEAAATGANKKRKRAPENSNPKDTPTPSSTIVFAATKHRVEYLSTLLKTAGYAVSYVYGNLDQTARKEQVLDFRAGLTNILVVTDVAARGLDLPYLANVINYDFPSQPKIFVHRVGRTARAGRKGWSYSLIRDSDAPYLIDLQLFLGQPLVFERKAGAEPNFAQDVVVGTFVQDELEPMVERVQSLHEKEGDLNDLQIVAGKGEAQYTRTRNSASTQSVKRAKELLASRSLSSTHLLFRDEVHDALREKEKMLERISSFRPTESIFEVGNRGTGDVAAEIMRKRREQIDRMKQKQAHYAEASVDLEDDISPQERVEDLDSDDAEEIDDADFGSESDDLEISVSHPDTGKSGRDNFQNSEFFMSYQPKGINAAEERGYGVHSGSYNTAQQSSNFVESARAAQMDLTNDETRGFAEPSKRGGLRWDKKSKKYVARHNDEDGSKGAKMVRGESGLKIAASFRSGRFHEWRKTNKVGRLPRVGEMETSANRAASHSNGAHYKHKEQKAPKEADRYRDDYHVQKKRVDEAKQNRIGKFKDGGGKSELKGADDVRKQRQLTQKRQDKNARPNKKRKL
ncbi:ATP-dependent RNA helicase-like protein dbp10 [Massarina eburnea CBS 473.64]|uniref:RNA helicase n=1 Tax=Massarina eburnea CBS 473.64 TaxID=1395130 RepID=A0A6A6RP28_9PLEO|nr:ATP-dependent RNA helicase-like protein dbp10 [Massarina eburnea CBS 473.64]